MAQNNVDNPSMNNEELTKNIRPLNSHVCVHIFVCILWHGAVFPL